ncbi:MAG: DUF362 domain-containing protein [Gemmatimonadetes bacterium]|jgi:uncharacterized protein (DUF362 family)|nr:DUF362 domain-containing protein [Gemmatimonadota bacterium]MBT5142926.1 DUF362 domain-containing protein [Gemmatimonadota bacterium]MBT5589520.1 DUF362 domain-containing protein [Gemmatimonadota bacterium]MBT5959939.1 DUF362 domain-containing protein [Gemmatimonadota bacterium]MBT6630972.1 DUF362 domain-containing protein [Gemmatimonadota bacterium]
MSSYTSRRQSWRAALTAVILLGWCVQPATATEPFQVAVVPSDDPALTTPADRTDSLTTSQIEAMVRRAVQLSGGLAQVVPDTARLVVLKPNVGARPNTVGVVTDARVVRAVALIVHEQAPNARIYIGAGSGSWISPDLVGTVPVSLHFTIDENHRRHMYDGFAAAGLRRVERELQERGIDIECFDLNFDRAIFSRVPGGGMAASKYAIAASILDADAWIDIPVAKTHGAKITAAMKNMYGLLPGHIYGWNKGRGTDVMEGIPHTPSIVDESFVDLMLITEPDFVVTDLIRGSEGGAFNDTYRRSNIIVAARDPIAADLVTARLMGFNPDDLEFAELAARRGHGPGQYSNVDVRGALVEPLVTRWIKAGSSYGGEWQEQADYGKSPRRWSLYGPVSKDHAFDDVASLAPRPGHDGWSQPVWFGHDRIDLDDHFDDPIRCAVYAWTDFTMPEDGDVRLWLGADEGIQVWIDGETVYKVGRGSSRRRGHRLGQVRLPWTLSAGEHRLIIRADQGRGAFEFSFNICEPIDDVRYAGNSYLGLDYHLPGTASTELVVAATDRWADEDQNQSDGGPLELFFDPSDDAMVPDSLVLVEPPAAPARSDFIGVATQLARILVAPPVLDALEQMPFGMTPIGLDAILDESVALDERYGPRIDDLLDWVGIDYWGFYGHGPEKTQAVIRGLLSRGLVPIRGQDGVFEALIGYRQSTDDFEVLVSNQHATTWQSLPHWWSNPWEGTSVGNALFYTTAIGQPAVQQALIDSFAHVAVAMARRTTLQTEDPLRGAVTFSAGLAAWDESVVIWERMPLSASWGAKGRNRQLLSWLRRRHLQPLAQQRETAAALFAWAATQAADQERRHDLSTAAEGYASTASVLRDLGHRLPQNPWGLLLDSDGERLLHLESTRGLMAQARSHERRAVAALAHLLRQEPLPEIRIDPLASAAQRQKLATIRAAGGMGVHYVTLRGETAKIQDFKSTADRLLQIEVHSPIPDQAGWRIEMQHVRGLGAYRVVQRPTADNGWRLEVRVQDDNRAWATEGLELVLWAIRES